MARSSATPARRCPRPPPSASPSRTRSRAAAPPWCGYLAADAATGQTVATCAFKSAPAEGAVEIAYHTFGPFERRGYATAMAAALVALAAEAPDVPVVVAHTLPETSASTRVLTATGFTCVGTVVDPDDGPVWRWTRGLRGA